MEDLFIDQQHQTQTSGPAAVIRSIVLFILKVNSFSTASYNVMYEVNI